MWASVNRSWRTPTCILKCRLAFSDAILIGIYKHMIKNHLTSNRLVVAEMRNLSLHLSATFTQYIFG